MTTLKERFLNGQCHSLAYLMSKRYGYPIYGVVDDDEKVDHFAVMNEEGKLFDARGWLSVDDFFNEELPWAVDSVLVSEEEFMDIVSPWEELDLELAEIYLERLAGQEM